MSQTARSWLTLACYLRDSIIRGEDAYREALLNFRALIDSELAALDRAAVERLGEAQPAPEKRAGRPSEGWRTGG